MDFVNKFYESLHNNKYVSTILSTFLVVYGAMAAPKLPKLLRNLFKNPIFKIIFLSLIAYSVNKDPKLSVLLSIVFVIVLSLIGEQEFFEGFADHDPDHEHLEQEKMPPKEDLADHDHLEHEEMPPREDFADHDPDHDPDHDHLEHEEMPPREDFADHDPDHDHLEHEEMHPREDFANHDPMFDNYLEINNDEEMPPREDFTDVKDHQVHNSLCHTDNHKIFLKKCCDDFRSGEPKITGKCLDRLEECHPGVSERVDFDYEDNVCLKDSQIDEEDEEYDDDGFKVDNDLTDEIYQDN